MRPLISAMLIYAKLENISGIINNAANSFYVIFFAFQNHFIFGTRIHRPLHNIPKN